MSGHNKWSSIKHKKAAVDAKKGRVFTKVIREITVAARSGGGDPDSNPALRLALGKARDANMPQENATRAIKRGTGELEGVNYEEVLYEGYAPGGIGLLVRALTDNRNRSAADIRAIFTKKGGSMASQGAVSYLFQRKGFFAIPAGSVNEEDLFMLATDAGAEDFQKQGEVFEIITPVESFDSVRKALESAGIQPERSELSRIPETTVPVGDLETAAKLQALVEALEDNDDVQTVYDNSDIPDEILEQLS
jgi:YebC/PmpR family DNA-binding regulatory protein